VPPLPAVPPFPAELSCPREMRQMWRISRLPPLQKGQVCPGKVRQLRWRSHRQLSGMPQVPSRVPGEKIPKSKPFRPPTKARPSHHCPPPLRGPHDPIGPCQAARLQGPKARRKASLTQRRPRSPRPQLKPPDMPPRRKIPQPRKSSHGNPDLDLNRADPCESSRNHPKSADMNK
jgi:hypothetical protein